MLRSADRDRALGICGALTGVVAYLLVAGVVVRLLVGLWWLVTRPGPWGPYAAAAARFETPIGLLAGNVAIAVLIPLAVLLVRGVHRAPARALVSVTGTVRWAWTAVAAAVAVVAFAGYAVVSDPGPWRAPADFWAFAAVIVLTTPLQAVAEEVFFRGYLLQALGSLTRSPWWGIAGSALLFAGFHGTQGVALFASRFAFGVVVGWLVVRTGGLEAGVAAHVVNNLLAWFLAAGTSSIAEVRAIEHVTWPQAFSDVAVYAVIAAGCAVLAGVLRVRRTADAPISAASP